MVAEESAAIFFEMSCGYFFTVGNFISTNSPMQAVFILCFIENMILESTDSQVATQEKIATVLC